MKASVLVLSALVTVLACACGSLAKTVGEGRACSAEGWFAAVRANDVFTLKACLEEHPELGNTEDDVGCTAIVNGAANGHNEVVEFLCDQADDLINVNHQCWSGNTAMHYAAQLDNGIMVRQLHKAGARYDIENKEGDSALALAAKKGNLNIVAYMNSLTEDIYESWSGSELMWAAAHHNVEHVKIALAREGVDIEDRDAHGNTALLWAARTGSVAMLEELLKHGASLTAESDCGWTAPFYAAYFKHKKFLEELMKHSVDLNKRDKLGWTPIMWAAAAGDVASLSYLQSAGASVQEQGGFGWTPLMMAAARNQYPAANYLLRHGADWRARNDAGLTAWEIAKEKGHDQVFRLLHRIYLVAEGRHEEL
eukprot:m.18463 g.18463  ORF g.18463 m.18463 type:complete len:367 (+) comp8494_c0_seq1:56-1156(+)